MRILVVGPFSSPIIQRLVKHLKHAGHEVLMASHQVKSSNGVISLGELTSFFEYFNFFKINKIVKEFNPDIVHAHVVNHYGLMSLMQPKPLVIALWGSDIMLAPHDGGWLKKTIFRLINWLVLKRAKRCHTSGFHVADEAEKQCKGVYQKIDVYYWGFPLDEPHDNEQKTVQVRMEKEFGLSGDGFVVFPRGLGPVYNPTASAAIINKLLKKTNLGKKIVVLKGFSNDLDENNFKSMVDLNAITYVNRLLTSDELYFLYNKSDIHVSIPLSDSLGGGVIEPALFGSYPILSNLPSYKKYAEKNRSLILENYEGKAIDFLCEQVNNKKIGRAPENTPEIYALQSVLNNIFDTYQKAKGDD